MWTPRFACPECSRSLATGESMICACGRSYARAHGMYGFLSAERRAASRAFAAQYGRVRRLDGHQSVVAACWRTLPCVPRAHPTAEEWHVRRQSWERFAARVLAEPCRRVLDLGAGSGWLSSRCASLGHHAVAVDRFDDDADVRAMSLHDGPPFVVVQAEFDALPFEPGQFDVAVFNASLHYAQDPEHALARSAEMLAPRGVLVVMDSPMFSEAADGEAMVTAHQAALSSTCDIPDVIRPGAGYLTFDGLDRAARRLGRHPHFVPSRGSMAWRVRRGLAPLRLGRAPASFGVWVAR